jgi:hypothetical protein
MVCLGTSGRAGSQTTSLGSQLLVIAMLAENPMSRCSWPIDD